VDEEHEGVASHSELDGDALVDALKSEQDKEEEGEEEEAILKLASND
jgi:hypothetical protein